MSPTTKVIWQSKHRFLIVVIEPSNSTSASETISEQEFESLRAQEFTLPTFSKPYN